MLIHSSYCVYRVISGFNGGVSGLIVEVSKSKAISSFCLLHNLYPSQVTVLYSYPIQTM